MILEAGPYTAGEVPDPLSYEYQDADGVPLDLTGFSAKFVYRRYGASPVIRSATIPTPGNGRTVYTWQAADMESDGIYRGEFFVSNLSNTYASEPIVWRVRAAVTVPTFP